jgi:hypothetical protein
MCSDILAYQTTKECARTVADAENRQPPEVYLPMRSAYTKLFGRIMPFGWCRVHLAHSAVAAAIRTLEPFCFAARTAQFPSYVGHRKGLSWHPTAVSQAAPES